MGGMKLTHDIRSDSCSFRFLFMMETWGHVLANFPVSIGRLGCQENRFIDVQIELARPFLLVKRLGRIDKQHRRPFWSH